MIRKNNKKAAVGSTMTWVFAIIIIVIVLVLYFAFMLGILTNKGRAEINVLSYGHGFQVLATDNLVNVLSSKVGVDEFKDLAVSDALLKSLDVYWSYLQDINQLYASGGGARVPSEVIASNKKFEDEIRVDIEDKFDRVCDRYIFESPNIKIDKKANKGREVQEEMLKFTDWVIIKIPYKNQFVEIKYRQLKNCYANA